MRQKISIPMKLIIKFGLAALAAGTFLWSTVPAKADAYASEFSNYFTKHGLPIPGAYFKAKENQQPAAVAVSKSGKGVGREQQTAAGKQKGSRRYITRKKLVYAS
jgi:hypothetical protein